MVFDAQSTLLLHDREELAAKGGWHVTGYPLCLDPVMAKYI